MVLHTVAEYHSMLQSGVLISGDPVELLDGQLVEKEPKSPLHSTINSILMYRFIDLLPEGWCFRSQNPITLAESEPEPDLAIVRGRPGDYMEASSRTC